MIHAYHGWVSKKTNEILSWILIQYNNGMERLNKWFPAGYKNSQNALNVVQDFQISKILQY